MASLLSVDHCLVKLRAIERLLVEPELTKASAGSFPARAACIDKALEVPTPLLPLGHGRLGAQRLDLVVARVEHVAVPLRSSSLDALLPEANSKLPTADRVVATSCMSCVTLWSTCPAKV